ncbi:unnamed protein product [Kuraishia capsulata CBS 1993]|uniref:Uncharacterized protein n=1 Tax=Kuraishia capsulata CBS 1993 TaxID=1382522 RepID=W6MMR2_9ASCO|nr:uncharacterized protein KUCA_T00003840001 [Kuraishia capsulata CBS 1993]CDK27861.1 unnamed protein product [Kuraishia capsulata CBS 1993]
MNKVGPSASGLDKDQEDIIAENILKRAEIARITRQLRSKLLKAGIKARIDNGIPVDLPSRSDSSLPSSPANPLRDPVFVPSSAQRKRRSAHEKELDTQNDENDHDNETDDYVSPSKKHHNGNLSSSPVFRESNSTPAVPQTPPMSSRAQLATATTPEMARTPGKELEEGSAQSALQNAIFATPKAKLIRHPYEFKTPTSLSSRLLANQAIGSSSAGRYENDQEEGADLLMFLATSPSPAYHKDRDTSYNGSRNAVTSPKTLSFQNLNSTPPRPDAANMASPDPIKAANQHHANGSSNGAQSGSASTTNQILIQHSSSPQHSRFATPAAPNTPGRHHKLQVGPKTPGFSMSDYVNLFTPSPRFSRTPDSHKVGTGTFLNLGKEGPFRSLDQQLTENDSDRIF